MPQLVVGAKEVSQLIPNIICLVDFDEQRIR